MNANQMAGLKRWCVALGLCWATVLQAQPCADLPAERTVSDQKGGCLAVLPIAQAQAQPGAKVLVVLLHGDGEGKLGQRQVDRWSGIGRSLLDTTRHVVFMVRPGYQSPIGDSSGWANPHDDDYTANNMARVAGALSVLKKRYQAEKLILVGHSGGAATSALVLGRHPGIADAALLLGCPCDVPPWRNHRNAQRGRGGPWRNSLNPLDAVASIPSTTVVLAVTGGQDDNTLPEFARRWVNQASTKGLPAEFEEAAGFTHSSIQQWPGIAPSVNRLSAALGH
ncbi:MAG: alpha/beta fold hydrolase [Pseudomonadota bacterium]|jgi:pimeloyl-ACP methyl ester carboxylesterase